MAVEVGGAFISVRPDLRGFHNTVKRDLRSLAPQMVRIGQEWGTALQRGIKEKLNPIEVRLDAGRTATQLATLNRSLDKLDGRRVDFNVRANFGSAFLDIVELQAALRRIDKQRAEVSIHVEMSGALAELAALEQVLARLDGRRVNVQVNADTAAAIARLLAANAETSRLDGRRANVNVVADVGSALAAIASVRLALIGLGAAASPALVGVGAGIAGLVSPLAAAGAGVGAFGAVAIPAISHVSKALQQQKQASQSAGAASGQATSQAFAEASARQQLASAVRNAAYAHQQALDQVRQAEQQYKQSLEAEAEAQRAVATARQQARRQIEDLKNQVIDAQLSIEEQRLSIEQSRASWDQMAAAAKAAGDKVAAAQAALTSAQAAQAKILADPAVTDTAKRQAKANVDAAQQALKGAEGQKKAADLAARQAEINYKQSAQRLKEQQLQLRRLQQDEKAASKAGVEGSDQVRSARQRLAQANQQVANSELALRRARENVTRTDQQSADQIASARRALAQANQQAAASTGALGQQLVKLTPLEQQLATAWKGLTSAFTEWNRALQPAVIPVLIKGINLLRAVLPLLTPLVRGAAVGIGYLLDRATAAARSPFWVQFAAFLGQAAAPAIIGLGTLLGNLATGLAGLVQGLAPIGFAFLQVLNMITARWAAFTTSLTSNPAFQQFTRQFIELVPLMAQTFGSLGSLIGSLFAALAPALQPALSFVNTLATLLAGVLRQLGPALTAVLSTLGSGLSAVLSALAPVVVQLGNALAPLLVQLIRGLQPILIALVPIIGQVIAALAPVISALIAGLQPAIAALVPVVGVLVGAIAQILPALTPLLPILGQFSALVYTQLLPILTPIINLIAQTAAQIGVALVDALRQSLPSIQQVVIAVASLLPALMPLVPLWGEWLTALLPLLPPLLKLVAVLVTLLVPVLRVMITIWVKIVTIIAGLIIPVWRLMITVIIWVAGLLTTILTGIGAAFRWLGQAATWLWTTAIGPAFRAIATIAKWLYSVIAFAVIAPLVIQFKIWAAVVKWLWSGIIAPIFRAIGGYIRSQWTGVIRPALAAIGNFLRAVLGPVFRWVYGTVIRPVWTAVGTVIRAVWNTFIRPTFDNIRTAVGRLAPYFRTAVDAIGRAWSGLREAARKPVAFVVNTVFNSGIVKIWDAVAKLVPGMKRLEPVRGFARGGVMPGYAPGRDRLLAAVSPGESIFRPEFTRAVGSDFVTGANSAARSGGVSGVLRFLQLAGDPGMGPGFAGHFALGGVVGGFLRAAKNWFAGGLVKTATAAFNPLISSAQNAIGGTGFGDLAVNAVRGLTSRILAYFKPLESKIGGGSNAVVRAARTQLGVPYVWGGTSWDHGLDCSGLTSQAWLRGAHKWIGRTTYAQYPASTHIGEPRPAALGFPHMGHVVLASKPGHIIEAPYTGASVREVPISRNYEWRWPNAAAGLKFDNGGWLPPGISTVANFTGRPEPVLTPQQLRSVGSDGSRAPQIGALMTVQEQHIHDEADVDMVSQRLGFAARSASFGS